MVALLECLDAELEGGGLDAAGAEQAPVAVDDHLDEHLFADVRWGVVLDEGFPELGVGDRVFVGQDGDLGREAVAERVELRDGFAGFGNGSCGALGVAAVGVDLLLGCHGGLFLWLKCRKADAPW